MRPIVIFGIIIVIFTGFAVPSLAVGNGITGITIDRANCNGRGLVDVSFVVDGEPRFVTVVSANGTADVKDVSSFGVGSFAVSMRYYRDPSIEPEDIITLTVSLGTSPWSGVYGRQTIYFRCTDGEGVTPAIEARNDRYSMPRNVPTILDVRLNDRSALPLIPRTGIRRQPNYGVVVVNEDNTLTYTAGQDYIGIDSFTYRICDISLLCDEATVTLDIFNRAPICDADANNLTTVWSPNHELVEIEVTGSDPDNDPITIIIDSIQIYDTEGGDGNTAVDYTIEGGLVRAERSGSGDGRLYELTVSITDIWGDFCTGEAYIFVPHDKQDTYTGDIINDSDVTTIDSNTVISTDEDFVDLSTEGEMNTTSPETGTEDTNNSPDQDETGDLPGNGYGRDQALRGSENNMGQGSANNNGNGNSNGNGNGNP
jgi:Big-like domain-containing protein